MSEGEEPTAYQFPENFDPPYKNSEERNDNLQVKIDMLNEDTIHEGVRDLLKKKNFYVQAMIEEEELSIPPSQTSVNPMVKEFTIAHMKNEISNQIQRLRFKSSVMSKKEFEDKMAILQSSLENINNQDLEGISFDKMKEFEEKLGLLPYDEDTKRHGMEATYQERIKAFEENIEEKNKNAEEFVRKMSAERKQRLQKKKEDRKKLKEKQKERKLKKQEEQEKDLIEKAQMRKELEEEIRERMKDHERYRQEMKVKWDKDRKDIAQKKYMYQSLEEKYQKKVVIPSLERKKEELRKKREHLAPIRHKDLVEHEKVYIERLKNKLKEKKSKREKWYKDIGYGDYDPSIYNSKYLSSVEQENSAPLIDPMEEVVHKCNKIKNYSKFVRQMHKPKISLKKVKEMEFIKKEGMTIL